MSPEAADALAHSQQDKDHCRVVLWVPLCCIGQEEKQTRSRCQSGSWLSVAGFALSAMQSSESGFQVVDAALGASGRACFLESVALAESPVAFHHVQDLPLL